MLSSPAADKIKLLNPIQVKALNKIGDLMCPTHNELPSFTQLGAIEYVDILMAELPPNDLKDLKLLLTILGFMPSWILLGILNFLEKNQDMNGEIGTLIRTVRFGFRGIIFSLYYSGLKGHQSSVPSTPDQIVGYKIQMDTTV
jgi:hypothetical protein